MAVEISEIIRSKRRTISLIITPAGRLVVRSPLATPEIYIRELVAKKQAWVLTMQQKVQAWMALRPKKRFVEGEYFHYLGRSYPLRLSTQYAKIQLADEVIHLPTSHRERAEIVLRKWYKNAARDMIQMRTKLLAGEWGYDYGSIRITGAKRRWGSCSGNNSLNFTWRLVMAPIAVIDYVILHELAHTKVKNHSQRFWALVKSTSPDYSVHRKWLREHPDLLEI